MPGFANFPSVTEIMRDLGLSEDYRFLPPAKLEAVQARGKAVHAAIEYHAAGDLDPASVHPVVRPFLEGYVKFADEHQHVAIASELALTHPWGFCRAMAPTACTTSPSIRQAGWGWGRCSRRPSSFTAP